MTSDLQAVQDLSAVRAMLTCPSHWHQGLTDRQYSWTLDEALFAVTDDLQRQACMYAALTRIIGQPVSLFNDSEFTTHTGVLEAIDKAIHLLLDNPRMWEHFAPAARCALHA